MNVIELKLEGHDTIGWVWSVEVDGESIFCTSPLAGEDMAEALFSIQRDNSRTNDLFKDASNDELFCILDGFFFGSLGAALNASAEEQTWARHIISPVVSTQIYSRLYIVAASDGEEDRLLVGQEGRRRYFRLIAGEFDKQLSKCRAVLEQSNPPMNDVAV